MIIDTSALVAVLRGEPDAAELVRLIRESTSARMSAASYLELGIVVDRIGDPVLSRRIDELLDELGIAVSAVTADQARAARSAYRDFGRGTGHPARLNFGDCFGYALATSEGDTLLFKGDDFAATDIRPAAR